MGGTLNPKCYTGIKEKWKLLFRFLGLGFTYRGFEVGRRVTQGYYGQRLAVGQAAEGGVWGFDLGLRVQDLGFKGLGYSMGIFWDILVSGLVWRRQIRFVTWALQVEGCVPLQDLESLN